MMIEKLATNFPHLEDVEFPYRGSLPVSSSTESMIDQQITRGGEEEAMMQKRRKRDYLKDKLFRSSLPVTAVVEPSMTIEEQAEKKITIIQIYQKIAEIEERMQKYRSLFTTNKLEGFPEQYLPPSFLAASSSSKSHPPTSSPLSSSSPSSSITMSSPAMSSSSSPQSSTAEFKIIRDSEKNEIIYNLKVEFLRGLMTNHISPSSSSSSSSSSSLLLFPSLSSSSFASQLTHPFISIRFILPNDEFDVLQRCICECITQFQKVHLLYFQLSTEVATLVRQVELDVSTHIYDPPSSSSSTPANPSSRTMSFGEISSTTEMIANLKLTQSLFESVSQSFDTFSKWEECFSELFLLCSSQMNRLSESFTDIVAIYR